MFEGVSRVSSPLFNTKCDGTIEKAGFVLLDEFWLLMTRVLVMRGEEDASGRDQSLEIPCLGAGGLNSWLGVCEWGRLWLKAGWGEVELRGSVSHPGGLNFLL